ncbi:MAG: hypothetical protein ACOC47_07140 [Alkalispirochaetaceae bacterium]
MKKSALLLMGMLLFFLMTTTAFAQEEAATDVTMEGTWDLYRVDTLTDFTINEYRNRVTTPSLSEAQLVLNEDGSLETDSPNLRFTSWRMDDGFLVFVSDNGNGFYAVRDLTEDVYFLVSLTVTERNARVTDIRTNPSGNLLVVRSQ